MSGTTGKDAKSSPKDSKDSNAPPASDAVSRDPFDEKTALTSAIDLGDDLLDPTRAKSGVLSKDVADPDATRAGTSWTDDQLQSARINLSEGFADEAKKILRKVLIRDPRSLAARKLLEEIQEIELKQIFSGAPDRRPAPFKERAAVDASEAAVAADEAHVDADRVTADLDRDFKLGMLLQDELQTPGELSLFADKAALERFSTELDRSLSGAGSQDRIDLAVGFLEMGIWDVAIHLLEAASRDNPDPEQRLSSLSLLAVARMGAGRAFDAIQSIQVALHDAELRQDGKVDLMYLMGRAHERLSRAAEALTWYAQVRELKPGHRDVTERLARLEADAARREKGKKSPK